LGPATAVVITDRRIAKQLLDKRSSVSSDRPANEVSQKIITEGDHLLWMNGNAGWRLMRKLIHQDLTETMVDRDHSKVQQAESVQMVYDMMNDNGAQWRRHLCVAR
jgi:cytochrome P450 family 619